MKKKQFFFGLLAAMTLAGCSSNDDVVAEGGDETVTISDGNPYYLAVQIADVNGGSSANMSANAISRATFDNTTADENKVNNVRFYFFNSDGSAANVKKSGSSFINYLDWFDPTMKNSPDESQSDGSYNVADKTDATLIINTAKDDKLPTKMLAVVNFTTATSSTGLTATNTVFGNQYNDNLGMTAVRDMTGDYAELLTTAKQFVMVTSTYATKNPVERFSTTAIEQSNIIQKTGDMSEESAKAAAIANPVKIYVERNVAKVKVAMSSSLTPTSTTIDNQTVNLYPIKDKATDSNAKTLTVYDKDGKATEYSLYFLPQGWNLTATTDKVYLSKHIELDWINEFTQWADWYDPTNHRSYWALNYQGTDNGSDIDKGGQIYNKSYEDMTASFGDQLYTNENAATNSTGGARSYPTQVVVAGTIVGYNSNKYEPLTVGDYESSYYTEEGMKTQMYNKVGLYVKGAGDNYTKLDQRYITFETSNPSATSQDATTRCAVKLALNGTYDKDSKKWKLNDDTETEIYTTTDVTTGTPSADSEEVMAELSTAGQGFLYKDGMTYYWFKVPHIAGKDKGEYGVVRNHYYNCSLTNVIGLGTPVYDPKETIYPETPTDVDTYIAAQVNILSWKNLEHNIDLGKSNDKNE